MVPRKILKITAFTHYKSLSDLLFRFVLFFSFVAWEGFNEIAIVSFGIMFMIDFLPSLYLHIEYWFANRGEEYKVLTNEIVQIKGGVIKMYSFDKIDKIILYLSPTFYKNSEFSLFTMDRYYYAEVVLKSGDRIIVTRLLSNNLKEDLMQIRGVLFERRRTQFCNINTWW